MVRITNILFRTDASLQIGTGHVMRCLTLADALATQGAECQFICRAHAGNLIEFIRDKGYFVHSLPFVKSASGRHFPNETDTAEAKLAHSDWLGATQQEDAAVCAAILSDVKPDWLIVDHYALDALWELALKPHYRKLMVIDDLADRHHVCDLLLDQTFGRDAEDYRAWVPTRCRLLCGSQYALLRPEFAALRAYSLQRRREPQLRQLLITMGGVDKDNVTGQILEALRASPLPADCRIVVVLGPTAPARAEVERQARNMPWPTEVMVNVGNMAQLMADSDLAIGAAGATSWERCCLGLPTIMVTLAENQQRLARELAKASAALVIEEAAKIHTYIPNILALLVQSPKFLIGMHRSAESIVGANGTGIVVDMLRLPA